MRPRFALTVLLACSSALLVADEPRSLSGDAALSRAFELQVASIERTSLADVNSLDEWQSQRGERLLQLHAMLGLLPLPEKSDLQPVVAKVHEHDGYVVENLHYQSLPGLYVTGNLYRPATPEGKLPAVLYVCGHGRVKQNGVSYGNKTHYHHHGVWFAKHGYVCLTIDTIQLGEIEGLHHGTHREGMFWWNNRGYTPAGVEAWNGIRGLDYLQSRPEVDGSRIGVTGRSGGGAYSWWVAALDERVKCAVPVAGITSLRNHVVDDKIEGHCDCMFMVNVGAWDFAELAALVAPRPLLISNTDNDPIFPLDGVIDVYQKTRRIYALYDKPKNVGLSIAEGPHSDTQQLRNHAFHWLNEHLKGDESLITTAATKELAPEELKVFDDLPDDEVVTSIHETFVPAAEDALPRNERALEEEVSRLIEQLKEGPFRNAPVIAEGATPTVERVQSKVVKEGIFQDALFHTGTGFDLPVRVLRSRDDGLPIESVTLHLLTSKEWDAFDAAWRFIASGSKEPIGDDIRAAYDSLVEQAKEAQSGTAHVYFAPRGIGPTAWTSDARERVHIRRRFVLVGQTLDSVRIHETLGLIERLPSVLEMKSQPPLHIVGAGESAAWALFAGLLADSVSELTLLSLAPSDRFGPELLMLSRITTIPRVVLATATQVRQLTLVDPITPEAWQPLLKAADACGVADRVCISE